MLAISFLKNFFEKLLTADEDALNAIFLIHL